MTVSARTLFSAAALAAATAPLGPAAALCQKVKAKGLPCNIGMEEHGVPKEWGKP
jgi:hypothetical protein